MLEVYYEKYVYVPKDPGKRKLDRNKFGTCPYHMVPDSNIAMLKIKTIYERIMEKVKNFPAMTNDDMEYVLEDFLIWIYRDNKVKIQLKYAKEVLERIKEEKFGESPAYYLYVFLLYVLAVANIDEDWNICNETIAEFSHEMYVIDRRLFW